MKGREELGDEGEVTWEPPPWTEKATAALRDLEEGIGDFVRMRSVTSAGTGDFGQVITFVVP